MKLRLAPFALALLLAACQRAPTPNPADLEAERRREEQIQSLDDRIAQLQDLERQATERKVAESEQRAAKSEQERQRLEKERQTLLRERERLAEAQQKAEQDAAEAERRAAETTQRAEQEREQRTMDLFYTALDPHGEWMEIGRYGYVWRPNEASDARWRPYTDGRWVFTEYGWTWKSNEPFGWAVYHYGRWARLRRIGWVWVPSTEWGPGWVSWRRGDRFVGWAPLPPEAWSGSGFTQAVDSYYEIGPSAYTFVPVEDIGEATYVGRVVQPEQNVTIVNQTVNVTNIHYTKVQNNTVVFNGGPELAEVNARSQQKIPRLNVERVTNIRNPKELGRAEQRGNTLVMAAPQIAPKKASERPMRVKEQVQTPEVDRGWRDLEKGAADQARARMKQEARQTEERQRKASPVREERTSPPQRPVATPVEKPRKTAIPATPVPPVTPATPLPAPPRRPQAPAKPTPSPAATPGLPPEELPESKATPPSRQRPRRDGAVKPATPEPSAPLAAPVPPTAAATPATPATPAAGSRKRERGPKASPAEAPATPAAATPPPAMSASPAPAPASSEVAPATPAPATPAGDQPEAAATPERRLPKVKRPRPGAAATPPSATEEIPAAEPASPEAAPAVAPEGKQRRRKEAGEDGPNADGQRRKRVRPEEAPSRGE